MSQKSPKNHFFLFFNPMKIQKYVKKKNVQNGQKIRKSQTISKNLKKSLFSKKKFWFFFAGKKNAIILVFQ